MKINKLFIVFCLVLGHLGHNRCFSGEINYNKFFYALGKVESNNNPNAHNKSENALGIYQIRKLYFLDAQKNNKELNKYKHSDCFNPEISKLVVLSYLNKYCKSNSFEEMVRCHNSGPNYKNKYHLTNNYWQKFKKYLDNP